MRAESEASALSKSATDIFLLLLLVLFSQDPLREALHELELPLTAVSGSRGVVLRSEPTVIRVMADGSYRIDGVSLSAGDLASKLRRLRETGECPRVVIEGVSSAYLILVAELQEVGLSGGHLVTLRRGSRSP